MVVGFCKEMEVVLPLTSVFMVVIIGNMWGKRRSFREEEEEGGRRKGQLGAGHASCEDWWMGLKS